MKQNGQINIFNNLPEVKDHKIILNKDRVISYLNECLTIVNLTIVKNRIVDFRKNIINTKNDKLGLLNITSNGDTIDARFSYLDNEIKQILDTQTLERTIYYISRLIKSLSEIKFSKINDINLNRWKDYEDIITDSLWVMEKRDNSGAHIGSYWGNFIPQIPNQLLKRYTKAGEWVLDPFLGSGTTLIECKRLGRNGIGIELQETVSLIAKKQIEKEINRLNSKAFVLTADSTVFDYKSYLNESNINSVQFIILHPPYHDIIKFSDNEKDLSNSRTTEEFLKLFGKVLENTCVVLDKGRYFAIVIGDKYSKGEWIPLGFYCMQEALKRGYKLKSTIVKNFEETKGKMNQKELWRYRALVGGFYIFKHEYIFLFKK